MKTNKIVQLREKPLKNGGKSLYLDINVNGRRSYEFLKIYLVPETDANSRRENRTMRAAAETIRAKRLLEIQEGKLNIGLKKRNFLEFAREAAKEQKATTSIVTNSAINKWEKCFGNKMNCDDITPDTLREFIAYLKKGVSAVTANNQYSRIRAIINLAYRKRLTPSDPAAYLTKDEIPHGYCKERAFLTIEEVKKLIDEPIYYHPEVKPAFLFSCFTGLRLSDLQSLRWTDISDNCIVKRQQKTETTVRIPLTENALAWLPKRESDELVFHLPSRILYREALTRWVKAAGIRKNITPHSARHTFATLLVSCGADLFVVSKLMGHASIASTQVYAAIVDKQKEAAVNLIPKL